MTTAQRFPRIILIVTIAAALLGGLGSGLARLGWEMDPLSEGWIMAHGPLMISGFLGTLIGLERAVALADRSRWAMLMPLVNAAGAVALLVAPGALLPKILLALGSLGLCILFVVMLRLHPSRDIAIMALGAVCWLIGNSLWLSGQPVFQVVHLWTAFLILTIVGERLELSRVRRLTPTTERLLVGAIAVYLAGVLLTILNLDAGIRLLGAGAVLMALWLLRYDIARRTIRRSGLSRYIAACLLLGYVWLGFGGAIAVWKGAVFAGPDYSIILHAFLLGFVFSMIFGHMPIILPALTGLRVDYHPIAYLYLVLLHGALALRMAGNLALNMTLRQWGGLFNVVAVLLFFAVTIITVLRSNMGREAAVSV